ncbi:ribose ABC transport system [Klebsiella michiganensis]|uniref:Ribose ABC transport system n=1 Tax=Klebsiella michiganensis TaxID=1134687 RepID=A0A7H4MZ16_9ENTR|nr:ribose ABC transport system [Klebsiella michiganensis]
MDIGAKREIYELIDKLARAGKAILVISSDLPEAIGISDRVLVMRGGANRSSVTLVFSHGRRSDAARNRNLYQSIRRMPWTTINL